MSSSLEGRLATLSITPIEDKTDDGSVVEIKHYFFKPKPAASSNSAIKLLVVLAEVSKDIGKATALAKQLGYKDLRAADDGQVKDVLGVPKSQASLLSIQADHSQFIHLVASSTLQTAHCVSFPNEKHSTEQDLDEITGKTVVLKGTDAKRFAESRECAEFSEVEFAERGEPQPAAPKAAAAPTAVKEPKAQQGKARTAEEEEIHELGIHAKKLEDFPGWYQQVLIKGDMIDYYSVSGCYILKPWSYGIWEVIQRWFDDQIKLLGCSNCSFPLFVSQRVLEKEKDHIEGFAPEVAWVTRAGSTDLEEPIAIRPTSETVMYPYYAKWIRSHRDLPLKLNQWNSVVRWEFKTPQPFLRTREFLWQEGHTAHLTKSEADEEVTDILDLYRRVYEELLAVPVIPGIKTEKEKFAGGLYTTTVEGFIPASGRGIQGGTSHCLGQNFSKMFNIVVQDPSAKEGQELPPIHVWQNSWGLSTRTIGVMVMVHGDDKGLVMPPRVAQLQVIVLGVGITVKTDAEMRQKINDKCKEVVKQLRAAGIKAQVDDRDTHTPGFKFADWELRGVPLRLEIGPKDLASGSAFSARRDTGVKAPIPFDSLVKDVSALLDQIQSDMFTRAKKTFDERVIFLTEWKDFVPTLNKGCICAVPWCDVEACEDAIKKKSAEETAEAVVDERAPSAGAKSLCIPFDKKRFTDKPASEYKCVKCGQQAKHITLFGRSY
ncbi:uncharacterized protein L969DRAFT_456525 [Mixia osmundae IAM 14324]|uniref:proline--tRNA ligase n=1 Tax=Mixia osmundae (strain CBS 9802 / IAM 14324 / JCM 22182 / KY 12970) TaxID=764103 RepID=G7DVX7_MIXOS|nr:uncharacterized protein L969DRAFT_456525 [Mixia osmundae IAM 14324]KEI39582.1 hypothetical protein L969DRAFT_456525 [Mixia osmundae IAM 14324]GAA94737.1 hypothetical protein E5Q_01391 [Mixia osmundae IAM 14324]